MAKQSSNELATTTRGWKGAGASLGYVVSKETLRLGGGAVRTVASTSAPMLTIVGCVKLDVHLVGNVVVVFA
ncbi:hypothetical protein Pyn_02912 [Prunus yedoensis var. nudiflora]|uniref:Uncharacterized protein n=1 Tax=Prunus yedoensis var. nudiflora TaxID=2094558 RepID=A0A314UWS7_PRUYE|nr:hypothetical protein Pyn_02912 [Prunus yedoensis var. nudiflora]